MNEPIVNPVANPTPVNVVNNDIEEIKENAIDIEKTRDGFKIKGKFWVFIIVMVVATICATVILFVAEKVGLIK